MDIILANSIGEEKRVLSCDFDIDIGSTNDFRLTIPYSEYYDIDFGDRVFVPNTEYGGIIQDIKGDTANNCIYLSGYIWRGYIACRYIEPGAKTGDLNTLIRNYVGDMFTVPAKTSINSEIATEDWLPALDVINMLVRRVNYRLDIRYIQTETGGYVQCEAVPAKKVGEVSQDVPMEFISEDNRMGVNHLICVGEDIRVDLFADEDGNISTTRTCAGIKEIQSVYVSGAANAVDLENEGREEFADLLGYKSITANMTTGDTVDLCVGDLLIGTDYITGITMTSPVTNKIVTQQDGFLTIQYSNGTESTAGRSGSGTGESGSGEISFSTIYPVGSIYISVNSTDPGTLFGGTWERIQDTFLLAAGSTYSAGDTGGEATHQLTESELPEISASYGIHGSGNGSIFYLLRGNATGTQVSGKYQTTDTSTNNRTGAYSYSDPGIKFGSNGSHNNMPPYLAVYVWQRTA